MRKDKSNFDRVRQIGFTFPGVVESTAYGSPAIKLKGRLLACMASHRSREPGSLVVRVSFEDRGALIGEAPEIYYVKEHYLSYECVLVRLSRISPAVLRDLLRMAYRFVRGKAKKSCSRSKALESPRSKS